MIKTPLLALLLLAAVAARLGAQTELIPNDKFADDGASWSLKVPPEASASESIVDDGGEKALCIDVQESPQDQKTPPDIRVQRLFGEISSEKNYRISFQAKASEPGKIVSYIYPKNEGARVLWRTEIKLDSEWKDFTYTFKGRETADNCVFGFSGLGKATNKFWFKDVVLTED